jgi:hypothetical protein
MTTFEAIAKEGFPPHAKDALWQLFVNGPTWDGALVSKSGRNWLKLSGMVDCAGGHNWLNYDGVVLALSFGYGTRKEEK